MVALPVVLAIVGPPSVEGAPLEIPFALSVRPGLEGSPLLGSSLWL